MCESDQNVEFRLKMRTMIWNSAAIFSWNEAALAGLVLPDMPACDDIMNEWFAFGFVK